MNEPETFLARWVRLKQKSGTAANPPGEAGAGESASHTAPSGPAAFDTEALLGIESINSGSDIARFLQPGVPAELTLAALRAAWVADPAIRDFIGIADSQWDFNDPTAMPGFGPLETSDSARSFAEQTVARINAASETIARLDGAAARPPAVTANLPREGQVDEVWLSSGMRERDSPNVAADRLPPRQGPIIQEIGNEPDAELEAQPGARVHGSALPKPGR